MLRNHFAAASKAVERDKRAKAAPSKTVAAVATTFFGYFGDDVDLVGEEVCCVYC